MRCAAALNQFHLEAPLEEDILLGDPANAQETKACKYITPEAFIKAFMWICEQLI